MTDHDPLCPLDRNDFDANLCPYCPVIVKVRADERERIAQAIERQDLHRTPRDGGAYWIGMADAARIARGESS